ncbi:MAG: hypothetical protein ABW044_06435, partial [Cellvibrio sp.]
MKLTSRFQLPENLPPEISRLDDKFGSAANDPNVPQSTSKPELEESVAPVVASAPRGWFLNFLNYIDGWSTDPFEDDETHTLRPFRAELFSVDQMEQHGKALAANHRLSRYGRHNRLLQRLDENEEVLVDGCTLLMDAVKAKSRIAPAGEWLLDNFY